MKTVERTRICSSFELFDRTQIGFVVVWRSILLWHLVQRMELREGLNICCMRE